MFLPGLLQGDFPVLDDFDRLQGPDPGLASDRNAPPLQGGLQVAGGVQGRIRNGQRVGQPRTVQRQAPQQGDAGARSVGSNPDIGSSPRWSGRDPADDLRGRLRGSHLQQRRLPAALAGRECNLVDVLEDGQGAAWRTVVPEQVLLLPVAPVGLIQEEGGVGHDVSLDPPNSPFLQLIGDPFDEGGRDLDGEVFLFRVIETTLRVGVPPARQHQVADHSPLVVQASLQKDRGAETVVRAPQVQGRGRNQQLHIGCRLEALAGIVREEDFPVVKPDDLKAPEGRAVLWPLEERLDLFLKGVFGLLAESRLESEADRKQKQEQRRPGPAAAP